MRTIIERRLKARRLDCPLIFHRTLKGQPGQPIKAFDRHWSKALADAMLPPGRLFHDLRRSAVRNLIRSGVGEKTAMAVSGHRPRAMFNRYDIIETGKAFKQVDQYLSLQPTETNVAELPTARGRTEGSASG